ncbi:antiviral reverse transcriptase Drt3b [Xanthomonas campestris]|uniref:antiviral reverse transcriptase Drt3b n=1 Tax=Xanthomonas campestris TaxID=339 RepID=UPI003CF1930E
MDKAKIRVNKKDNFRALVTETSPLETPIIFSNDGLYLRSIKNASTSSGLAEQVYDALVKQENNKLWHIPYSYRIKKTELSYRNLSILHPSSQWRICDFYKNYDALIIHYTSRSNFTLRAPQGIASSFFIKSPGSDASKYKRSQISLTGSDKYLSHSPSYFSYKGYGRLYKFFDSNEFIDLEARYGHLWMLDVSKCFDSIYTHTILWAIKQKGFAKDNFKDASFGQKFDALMQAANYGETSGIVIGPEISRVFAEIILQEVDVRARKSLALQGLLDGQHYVIRRYVDDYFVFAAEEKVAYKVYLTVETELIKFKLRLNEGKVQKYTRPFLTEKSKSILDAKELLSVFAKKFTEKSKLPFKKISATTIYDLDRLYISFCNDVKMCCIVNRCGYGEISSYLISGLKGRATALMDGAESDDPEDEKIIYEALALILKCAFFLYDVAPSVTASYRLSTLIIMMLRFGKRQIPRFSHGLVTLAMSETTCLIESLSYEDHSEGFVDLESQNVLLAVCEFSNDTGVPTASIDKTFMGEGKLPSYFNLVSAMYYIKDSDNHATLKKWVCESVDEVSQRSVSVKKDAEKALTILDFVGCPYIDRSRREVWAKVLLSELSLPFSNAKQVSELIDDFEAIPWFIDWKEIDLLNLLGRKELRSVY